MNLVLLLEERSMKEFLDGLLPRILPERVHPTLIPHDGKSDLEKSIPRKLRAWRNPDARFVIVRDQDAADCEVVKSRLRELCTSAGRDDAVVRIACRELEAWFLGDLSGVEQAFSVAGLAALQAKEKYRNPDRLSAPSRVIEELVPSYGKVAGARALGPVLSPERCASPSFAQFLAGLEKAIGAPLRRTAPAPPVQEDDT